MVTNEQQELINRIYDYRVRSGGMSVGEFANRCGVTAQTIYMLLRGVQNPSKMTKLKIERVLKGNTNAESNT